MAALKCIVSAPSGGIPCTNNVAITVLSLAAPTNQRLRIIGFTVGFNGANTAAKPVQYRLMRNTTAGTKTAQTPKVFGMTGAESVQATGGNTFTVEPTKTDCLKEGVVQPSNSDKGTFYGFADEVIVPGGGQIGLEILIASGETNVNFFGDIQYEE